VIAPGRAPADAERAIVAWTTAFNGRNLETMLALMHPMVDFHPLSLDGSCRAYRGHDAVREWFDVLSRCRRGLRIERLAIVAGVGATIVATGVLTRASSREPTPFCGLHVVEGALIIAAHHHLSDPDSLLAASAR
jgi:hypothetical protein